MLPKRCLVTLSAILFGCATVPAPALPAEIGGAEGRSCDGVLAARADTAVDSKDALLASVQPINGRLTPVYPTELRSSGTSGRVIASFVIDTLGRVPPGGAWIQQETQRSFGEAVCTHLKRLRFAPLIVDGRRRSVRVLNWPTSFYIVRSGGTTRMPPNKSLPPTDARK